MSQSPETVFINFYVMINAQTVQQVMNLCTQLVNEHRPKTLYFAISSNGGDIGAGFTLYNYLVGLPINIVMHNIGAVDSIATVIFLAGAERYASPHSTFLYHGVALNVHTPSSFTVEQVKERLDSLEADEQRISEAIADKTNFDVSQVQALQKQGRTINPSLARENAIIHDIRELSIPKGAPIINIVM